MVGWYLQLDGHEFEQALGVGDGQGSLVCCSPWGRKELDTSDWTELNRNIPYEPPDVTLTGIMHQFIVRLLEILASNNTNNFVFMIIEYILKIFSYFYKVHSTIAL